MTGHRPFLVASDAVGSERDRAVRGLLGLGIVAERVFRVAQLVPGERVGLIQPRRLMQRRFGVEIALLLVGRIGAAEQKLGLQPRIGRRGDGGIAGAPPRLVMRHWRPDRTRCRPGRRGDREQQSAPERQHEFLPS